MAYLSGHQGKGKHRLQVTRPDGFAASFPAAKFLVASQHGNTLFVAELSPPQRKDLHGVNYYLALSKP
jgi:hypothetical protein